MEVQHRESDSKGAFYIDHEGAVGAELTYSKAGENLLILDHTDVSDALRGQGVGKLLVAAAVEHARAHDVKILPLCPFARSVFDKEKDYADVLKR